MATVADLQKARRDEVNALKAEMKNVQRGVPTGAEDALSPTQQLAFEQVSLFVANCVQFITLPNEDSALLFCRLHTIVVIFICLLIFFRN